MIISELKERVTGTSSAAELDNLGKDLYNPAREAQDGGTIIYHTQAEAESLYREKVMPLVLDKLNLLQRMHPQMYWRTLMHEAAAQLKLEDKLPMMQRGSSD
jgi:hypothetical protein